jgi:uncharacterized protein (TIGR00297 family)
MLTCVVTCLLALAIGKLAVTALSHGWPLWPLGIPFLISLAFGVVVWALRAATPGGITIGILVCLLLTQHFRPAIGLSAFDIGETALPALISVFAISFVATRYGRARKEAQGLAEERRGRRASQIAANLGIAALFAASGLYEGCFAALAEAASDTASSEIGQVSGGTVRLITTWKIVPSGTNGGISVGGTLAGVIAAAIIVAIGAIHPGIRPHLVAVFLSACAGLLFDSLLGATVEGKGWIGNDLVNFTSTLFAALLATLLSS